jgi:hypothetical protein
MGNITNHRFLAHGILLLCGLELDALWLHLEFPLAVAVVVGITAVNCTNYQLSDVSSLPMN